MLSKIIQVEEFDICRACLEAGPEGAIERSIKQAEYLEQLAALHREAFPEILTGVKEWKTGRDYDAVLEAFEKQGRDEEELYRVYGDAVSKLFPQDVSSPDGDEFPF